MDLMSGQGRENRIGLRGLAPRERNRARHSSDESRGEDAELRLTPHILPDLSTRRRREHCKNHNTPGQGFWVDARRWGRIS